MRTRATSMRCTGSTRRASGVKPNCLMHFDQPTDTTAFIDETGRIWAAYGNAKHTDVAPKMGTARATVGTAATDYIATTDRLDQFTFGTGDFFFQIKIANLLGNVGYFIPLEFNTGGTSYGLQVYCEGGNVRIDCPFGDIGAGTSFMDGNLGELALGRVGNEWKMYWNGEVIASGTEGTNSNWAAPTSVRIGSASDGNHQPLVVDEFRMFKGYSPYNGAYTVSTAAHPNTGLVPVTTNYTLAAYFASGKVGRTATYTDWETSGALFQDAQGTTPVTALEQPVGLSLDRSKGDRRIDITTLNAWNAPAIGGPAFSQQAISSSITAEKTYEIKADVTGYSGTGSIGVAGANFAGANVPARFSDGPLVGIIKSSGTGPVQFFTRSTNTANFSNISVREIPGNHRIQALTTSRHILTARKNLLVNSALIGGGAIPTGWSQGGGTGTSVPVGTINGNTVYRQTGTNERPYWTQAAISIAANYSLTVSVYTGQVNGTLLVSGLISWNHAIPGASISCTVNGISVLYTDAVPSNSFVTLTLSTGTTAGVANPRVGLGVSNNATGDIEFSRPMVTIGTAAQIGRYQRTGLSPQTGDYDAVGFPVGLRYDGQDDSNKTAAPVDYSGTDKATTIWSGVKLSDAAPGILMEHSLDSNTTAGGFGLFGPSSATVPNFSVQGRGSVGQPSTSNSGFTAPVGATVTGTVDIAGSMRTIDVNGITVSSNATIGTGNLASAVQFFGRRNDTTIPANAIEYGDFNIGQLLAPADLAIVKAAMTAARTETA